MPWPARLFSGMAGLAYRIASARAQCIRGRKKLTATGIGMGLSGNKGFIWGRLEVIRGAIEPIGALLIGGF